MAQYKIKKKATEDLSKIWLDTNYKWSENQADEYLRKIFYRFNLISENPFLGKNVTINSKNYQYLAIESHLIFYRRAGTTVEIIRVLYKGMQIQKHLK